MRRVCICGLALVLPLSGAAQEPDSIVSPEELDQVARAVRTRSMPVVRRLERRRRRPPRANPRDGRALFSLLALAAAELAAVDIVDGDANGQLRQWDEWGEPLTRLRFRPPTSRSRHDCQRPEVVALAIQREVAAVRRVVTSLPEQREGLLLHIVRARLRADEAARRRARGLSCEDLPNAAEMPVDIPELETIAIPSGLPRTGPAWRLMALNVALFGRGVVERIRTRKRDEVERTYSAVLQGIASGSAPSAITGTPVPGCGQRSRLSEETTAEWRSLGADFSSSWFAYSAEPTEDGVSLVARADIDCDGQIEEYASTIGRRPNGDWMRTATQRR